MLRVIEALAACLPAFVDAKIRVTDVAQRRQAACDGARTVREAVSLRTDLRVIYVVAKGVPARRSGRRVVEEEEEEEEEEEAGWGGDRRYTLEQAARVARLRGALH